MVALRFGAERFAGSLSTLYVASKGIGWFGWYAFRSIESPRVHHTARRRRRVAVLGTRAGRPDLSRRYSQLQSARIAIGQRAVRRVAPQWLGRGPQPGH